MVVQEHGLGAGMQLVERPRPTPGPGQVLIRAEHAGVNWADLMQRNGEYPTVLPVPYIPGHEVAGVVASVGDGVADVQPGQRVAAMVPLGAYAELVVAPAAWTLPMAADVDTASATALLVQGLTAQLLVKQLVRAGDRVLVTAAAGGVGSLVLQLAVATGASRVVGVAHGANKCRLIEALGAVAVDYALPDWPEQARAAAGGGFDCIVDAVGGNVREAAYALLAPFGRMGIYGNASREEEHWNAARWHRLLMANQSVCGYAITNWLLARPAFMREAYAQQLALLAQGALRVQLHPEFQLEEAEAAHRALAQRQTLGKVVLRV
jgi:NADPH2:quinone reductase